MSASDQLCRAFGDQFENVNRPSSAVHGGLNNAIIYDYTKDQLLEAYHFATVGPHHNNATGCIFRDKASGIIWAGVTTHPENLPDGSNKRHTSYDDRREQQVGSALRQMVAKVDAARVKYRVEYIPLILGLDANGDRNDAYDGPGRAAAKYGLVDVETIAESVTGYKGTWNGRAAAGGKTRGDRLDRFFVPKGTRVPSMNTIPGWSASDHNFVVISAVLTNKK